MGFGSVAKVVDRTCRRVGARHVVIALIPDPVSATAEGVLDRVEASITPRTRVAIFDDITSNTVLRLPAARLARLCRERDVVSIVDAAHSVEPSAADDFLDVLHSADVVAGNLHKWACAPRGTGFLHVRSPCC